MTTSLTATQPTVAPIAPAVVCPTAERADFFFDLELLEMTMVIPQATPTAKVAKY